jgi:hypothetical protein
MVLKGSSNTEIGASNHKYIGKPSNEQKKQSKNHHCVQDLAKIYLT